MNPLPHKNAKVIVYDSTPGDCSVIQGDLEHIHVNQLVLGHCSMDTFFLVYSLLFQYWPIWRRISEVPWWFNWSISYMLCNLRLFLYGKRRQKKKWARVHSLVSHISYYSKFLFIIYTNWRVPCITVLYGLLRTPPPPSLHKWSQKHNLWFIFFVVNWCAMYYGPILNLGTLFCLNLFSKDQV